MEKSYYEGLPIYKSAMDLVVKLDLAVRSFPQFHRYILGTQMRSQALMLLCLIVQAMRREERVLKVSKLCEATEDMKLLCNVAREVKAFTSFKQFMLIMEQVIDVTRQAEGWRKGLQVKRPEPSKADCKRFN